MTDANQMSTTPALIPTGVPGLDAILRGGFQREDVYLILGRPGTGKTTLCNQICFNHIAAGGRAAYITLLAETHSRLFRHLRSFSFFNTFQIGTSLVYYSGYAPVQQQGLDGLSQLLQTIFHQHRPTLMVLDSMTTSLLLATSSLGYKEFIHRLQAFNEAYGCTTLLIRPTPADTDGPEDTLVDGILELSHYYSGLRPVRELRVVKCRGVDYLDGGHVFAITRDGVVVYPRTEAFLASTAPPLPAGPRLTFGIPAFDEMLGGGVPSATTTVFLGGPGSGKTLLGLHFLVEGARQGETGLYFGFREAPREIANQATQTSLPLADYLASGVIETIIQSTLENHLDALIMQLIEAVQHRRVQRLFIDGLDGFRDAAIHPERLDRALTSLTRYLQSQGVTTIGSFEIPTIFGPSAEYPLDNMSLFGDNIVFLRQVELRSQLYRLVSILKMRGSHHSRAIREFTISDRGIEVASTFESAEAILTGVARPLPGVDTP